MTSTRGASAVLTSRALAWPPIRLPQRGAVIQVVADDCAVTAGSPNRLLGDSWGRLRERREDAARVKPARALGPKDSVPVDLTGPELRDGRVAPIGAAECRSDAEAALREVQPLRTVRPTRRRPPNGRARGPRRLRA